MVNMKKITAVILCVIMSALMLAGLAGCRDVVGEAGEPYLGTWIGTKAKYEDVELSVDDAVGGVFLFILNKDGTAAVTVGSDRELAKWRPTDEGIVLIEGTDEFDMVASGSDVLIWNYEGVDIYVERSED